MRFPRCSPFGCQWGSVVLNRILLGRISERVYYSELHIYTYLYNRKPHEHNRIQQKNSRTQHETEEHHARQCPLVPSDLLTALWSPCPRQNPTHEPIEINATPSVPVRLPDSPIGTPQHPAYTRLHTRPHDTDRTNA